jgi:hypothetical protein
MTYEDWLEGLNIAIRSLHNNWTRPVSYELKKLNIIEVNTYVDYCLNKDCTEIRQTINNSWNEWAKYRIFKKLKVDA